VIRLEGSDPHKGETMTEKCCPWKFPQDDEEDVPFGSEYEEAREDDREAVMRADAPMAIASSIPGWVVLAVSGHVIWVTCDLAETIARDLRLARRNAQAISDVSMRKVRP
jgi:hypothetical protein